MTLVTPLYMQPASGDPEITYSALQDRAGLLDSLFSREGVLDVDAGQLLVTPRAAGANYSVDIAAGRAAIRGDDASDQGTYVCLNTTAKNVATPARPASGTRRHRLVARVRDKLHNGTWTVYDWTLQILADTGSGTPAQPASAITLAFITMTSTMSSVQAANIEDARPRAIVGTPERTGLISPHPALTVDAARPYSWHINADGWVSLAGWARQTSGTFTAVANTFYGFTGELPAEILPNTFRDFLIATASGPAHVSVNNGIMQYRFFNNAAITQNATWFSLDGAGYKL